MDALVGRLIAFELDSFDNYVPTSKNIESAFEAKLSLKEKGKKIKENQSDSEEETKESLNSDLEVFEALLAKKYSRSRGKYKGKIPLIYFSCEEASHIVVRCQTKIVRMKRRVTSTKEKRISKVTNHTRTKVRKLALWLRI